jgi:hypothetical protein
MFTDDMSVWAAKIQIFSHVGVDAECPVCTQLVKVYKRQVHASMASTLIRMYRAATPGEFLYLPDINQGKARDASYLRFWSLIEHSSERRPDGGQSGWWRVTEFGEQFVLGNVLIRKYARVFLNTCLELYGDLVSIRDCLQKKFDYDELMKGGIPTPTPRAGEVT